MLTSDIYTILRSVLTPFQEVSVIGYLNIPMLAPYFYFCTQNELIEQLDTFTSSIENLKEQIAQRRKHYEHYRDQLLDINRNESNEIHSWGEFCEMIKGNGVQKVDFVEKGRGCIHYGQIYTHYGPFTYTTNKFVSEETYEKLEKLQRAILL